MAGTVPDGDALVDKILSGAAQLGVSDIHLRAGAPPFFRVDGRLARTKAPPLTPELVHLFLEHTSRRVVPETGREWEYSFDWGEAGRFRGHAFRESGVWAVSLRLIPHEIPSFADLRLPPVVKALSEPIPGLVLVTGPTGSGKSTSIASMLRYLAAQEVLHVVTIEDPVEYRLGAVPACVSQREIGRDTESWSSALAALLRENPDVSFIGEIRDKETLEVALQAAETGHSVYSTFHTASALQTILRILALYGPDEQAHVRSRLADALRGIVSQRLLPRRGTRGRILCAEIMVNNYAVKEALRDPARLRTLPSIMERSRDQQMQTFDQGLHQLVSENLVASDVAFSYAVSPNDLRRALGLAGM